MEEFEEFKDVTRTSFKRVKQHIIELEGAVRENRVFILEQNEVILHLKSEIKLLMDEFKELREEIKSFEVSTGNGGVINDDQQCPSTMINNDQQSSTMINNHQQSSTMINNHQQ